MRTLDVSADAPRMTAAAALAHEMAQPLTAIGTYARAGVDLVRHGSATPAELERILQCIVAETARTAATVQRLRDFFRTGAVHRDRIDLARLVADVCETLRERLRATGIDLSVDLPAGLPTVIADRVQIVTVLHNLVDNAVDALASSAPPRRIALAVRESGAFVEIDVADNGPGIDPLQGPLLFEPLVTTKPTGMGLGLAIARKLARAHGGCLDLVASHPPTFRLTLPIHGTYDS